MCAWVRIQAVLENFNLRFTEGDRARSICQKNEVKDRDSGTNPMDTDLGERKVLSDERVEIKTDASNTVINVNILKNGALFISLYKKDFKSRNQRHLLENM